MGVQSKSGMNLTGIICGRDQGLTLEAAIRSLQGCDGVIYMDSGSQDASVPMAVGLGARVIVSKGDARNPRNVAAEAAAEGWAIWISPDDVLLPGGVAAIRAAVATVRGGGINVTITERKFPGHRFEYPRVFRTSARWRGRVHEYLDAPVWDSLPGVVVEHQRGPWHDKPTDPMAVRRALKAEMADDPGNPRWLYYLAREWYYAGEYGQASVFFERRVKMGGWAAETADAWLYLARCYRAIGRVADARAACLSALAINAEFAEAAAFMAEVAESGAGLWRTMASAASNAGVLFVRPTYPSASGLGSPSFLGGTTS